MIEELLKLKKITPQQYDVYILFAANELGRKVVNDMTHHYFMEEPKDMNFSGEGFAFYDGRRSVFRDIHGTIKFVQEKMTELEDDRPKSESIG
jgi:hypothetical protein